GALSVSHRRVLELGAGPGFFSDYAQRRRPELAWIAADILETPPNDPKNARGRARWWTTSVGRARLPAAAVDRSERLRLSRLARLPRAIAAGRPRSRGLGAEGRHLTRRSARHVDTRRAA